MKRIYIIHNDVGANPPPDDLDTLAQAALVFEALKTGYEAIVLPVTKLSDLTTLPRGCIVFNLVEEWKGDGYEAYRIPKILEKNKLPFTGAGSRAMMLTGDKQKAKAIMSAAGIDTPAADTAYGAFIPGAYIIKPARQSGSKGIDESAVINAESPDDIHVALYRKDARSGYFAERYIDGREISVSMLGTENGGARVLPPREMQFAGFGRYKILDYASKWDENSKRYQNTVSETMTRTEDKLLINSLTDISLKLWELFELRGWARVDFRVSYGGKPFVLEVNCNPCLCPPDSSFYLAAESAGLSFKDIIGELIANARF